MGSPIIFYLFGLISASAVAYFFCKNQTSKLANQKAFFEHEKKTVAQAERFAALGDFGAGIAHEINNPLAIILGRTQALKLRLDKDRYEKKDVLETLDKVEFAVKRISKIVNALRLMTRDSSNEEPTVVPISTIIEDIESIWSARLKNHGFEFSIENRDPDLLAYAKRTQIAHALFNLIANSYEFLKEVPEKWIKIDISEKNGFIQIGITDSGLGIPEDIQQKIFDPFYTTKEIGKGTGLGLSIARGVADDNNGTLQYDNQSPNTRFVFSIPKIDAAQKTAS